MAPPDQMARSILITGASTGIGLATARLMKARGWRVLATARRPEDLTRLARDEGLETIALELTDGASIAACTDAALALTERRLTAVYNNAAYGLIGALEDISGDLLRRHFEANVIGTHELTRRLIPAMRANGHGRIVMCSSVLGFVSAPYRGAYCASKFALEALSDALRLELKGSGIHVAIIEPGPIETQFLPTAIATFKANVDMANSVHRAVYERRLADMERGSPSFFKLAPEAVATRVAHALESRRPKIRYRVTIPTHGAALLKRLLPAGMLDLLVGSW